MLEFYKKVIGARKMIAWLIQKFNLRLSVENETLPGINKNLLSLYIFHC